MLNYYFLLGLRSLRRNPVLTALMVLTLAVGVAASVATSTVLHVMSGDPIPHKSDRLFAPLLDAGPVDRYKKGDQPDDNQLTYRDAANLLTSGQGVRRTALYGLSNTLVPDGRDVGVLGVQGVGVTRDFFAMFEAPFLHGNAWGEEADAKALDTIVLGQALSEKLFGTTQSVGKTVSLSGHTYQVVGVLAHWLPIPRFYLVIGGNGAFGNVDDYFIPFATAIRHEMPNWGSTNCSSRSGPGFQGKLASECTWIQFWFEMNSASERQSLQRYLDQYAQEQFKLGRLQRAAPAQLFSVVPWLQRLEVVGNDSRLAVWLAFGFLLLCLVNTVGLLLAKFSVRAGEVGVRRALGASRRDVFTQFLVEAAVVGLAGGLLGLALAQGALALIALQSRELAAVAHMDVSMLALTFALALLSAVLAGLLPTWRACRVTPALQLKSQ